MLLTALEYQPPTPAPAVFPYTVPLRQLAFLRLLKDSAARGAQFVIVTHSPIIMAYPGAAIWSFEDGSMRLTNYTQIEHVIITRDFLNHPDTFLKSVLDD